MTHLRVWTSSGAIYELRGGWVTRLTGRAPARSDYQLASLRRDGEPIAVVNAATPVVGERWQLLLRVREDGILTVRDTTPVVRIVHPHKPPNTALAKEEGR